jgi:hypothetical protein
MIESWAISCALDSQLDGFVHFSLSLYLLLLASKKESHEVDSKCDDFVLNAVSSLRDHLAPFNISEALMYDN